MANLIVQENGAARTTPAVHGEEITIQAPCDCTAVTGVQIAGVAFPFYDACGNSVADISGKFAAGSLVRVLIDTANTRATIINRAIQSKVFTASATTAWTKDATNGGYYQDITVTGIKSTDNPTADIALGSDVDANELYLEAWAKVTRIVTSANSVRLYANSAAPTTAFNFRLKVVR